MMYNLNKCTGITGATIKLDDHGDSEGNFSVVALKSHDFQIRLDEGNFTCPYYMIPVAQFYHGELLVSAPLAICSIPLLKVY